MGPRYGPRTPPRHSYHAHEWGAGGKCATCPWYKLESDVLARPLDSKVVVCACDCGHPTQDPKPWARWRVEFHSRISVVGTSIRGLCEVCYREQMQGEGQPSFLTKRTSPAMQG